MPELATETVLRGWALAVRDLVEQGAVAATIALHGDPAVTITYTNGRAVLLVGSSKVTLTDEELDATGLIPCAFSDAVDAGLIETEAA